MASRALSPGAAVGGASLTLVADDGHGSEPPAAERGPGPLGELLLVGGATPVLFALSWLLRRWLGLDPAEYAVGFAFFYGAYLINDPHFAVSYLLFYRDVRGRALGESFPRAQRMRWWLAGVVVPLLLSAWAIGALWARSSAALGALIQLMFLLVGWHYVKQGFGLMLVLAARRGVFFSGFERLAILGHCYAGWAYAWASPADPGSLVAEKGVVFTTIARSALLERTTFAVFIASALLLAAALGRKLLREGRLPLVTPLTALLCSIWVWSVYSSRDPLVRYAIPALHSLQYLYIVYLYRRGEASERERAPFFEASVRARLGGLAGSALVLGVLLFHLGPSVLDAWLTPARSATTDLGATPYFAALFAVVNLHHYFMDAVLWRRDNPLTRHLRA